MTRDLFASGRAIDLVLLVVAIEALVLLWRGGRRPAPLEVLGPLLPGALLLVALRGALTGADYRWTAFFLTASFPAHLLDLAGRRRARGL